MALVIADRVKETSTTTGTGTLTLGGAATGYQTFSAAIGSGNTCYYAITLDSAWEVGIGTVGTGTLTRDTILASSNAGAAVSFGAGTKDVFATYPAGRAVYKESGGNVILDVNSTSAALRITQTGSGNALVVEDATNPDSTPFVVAADGTVLWGATSVQNTHAATTAAVQVHSNVASNYYASIAGVNWVAGGQGSSLILSKSRSGTIGTQTVVQNGDQAGAVYFDASDGTQFLTAAQIQAVIDGTPGTNDMPGRLVFSTTADGASSPTERFRISNFGGWGLAGANYGTSGTQAIVSNGNAAAPTWQDVVTPTATQTLTNKTLTTPVISSISNTGTLTLPTSTDTLVGRATTDTLTNKTLTDPAIIGTILEDIYTITDGAAFEIDPGNGSIQLITLGASRTPKATNFANGESVTLMVDDGTAYTLTWTDATFGGSGVVWKTDSGSAPTLNTSGYTAIVLWKVGGQVYGARVGNA